jgi:ParB family transcriptional regulator, chromosome partitioning protein
MAPIKPTGIASVGTLRQIDIDSIAPNMSNPRKTFDAKAIERLAASIEENGLLVPITVYEGPRAGRYILLDGERRYRAAKQINKSPIPALVVPRPSAQENAVRMFNIHMLREDWEEIETAWALEHIMKETGLSNDRELHELTGLSIDRIRNMKRVLSFPRSHQEKVGRGELKYQALVELDKNVLSRDPGRSGNKDEAAVLDLSKSQLRDVFLKKFESGVENDIVELRHVGALIDTARAAPGKIARRAQAALTNLVNDPDATIREAYEVGAASTVEISKVLRDLNGMPGRVIDLLSTIKEQEEQDQLARALKDTIRRLQKCLELASR